MVIARNAVRESAQPYKKEFEAYTKCGRLEQVFYVYEVKLSIMKGCF